MHNRLYKEENTLYISQATASQIGEFGLLRNKRDFVAPKTLTS